MNLVSRFLVPLALLLFGSVAGAVTTLPTSSSVNLDLKDYSSFQACKLTTTSPPKWASVQGGAYIEYTLNATKASSYSLSLTYSTPEAKSSVNIFVAGSLAANLKLASTGSWTAMKASADVRLAIPSGQSKLRIAAVSGSTSYDISGIRLTPIVSNTEIPAALSVQAINMDTKKVGGREVVSGIDAWNVWSNGTISHAFPISQSASYALRVRAAGEYGVGAWPIMVVSVEGGGSSTFTVNKETFEDYSFNTSLASGTRRISIEFKNDALAGSDDRNLLVQSLSVLPLGTSTTPPLPVPVPAPVPLPTTPASGYPFAGQKPYVDPNSTAARNLNACSSLYPNSPHLMQKIASRSRALWLGDWNTNVRTDVSNQVSRAKAAGQMAVFVAYNIPNRDCGSYSAGGTTASNYGTWISDIAYGIGKEKAALILEPDALGQMNEGSCLSAAGKTERYNLLKNAIATLKKIAPNTAVYLDAGNPDWLSASTMAPLLKNAGIASADGFALNVSNYVATSVNVAYGTELSKLVGGKHFVIDTSRNGNGSAPDKQWCNPSGRALGESPQGFSSGLVDAYLWIKAPGESDGSCNGGPPAGQFWAKAACDLAARAKY